MRNNKKMRKKYIAGILACALIAGSMSSMDVSAAKKISLSSKKITINKGGSKTIKVKNTKKKVKWKIVSGKANITLKKKGKTAASIKGKKKGTAKVQAIVGKKKLTCKVTVKEGKKEAPSSSEVPTLQPATTNQATTNPGTNAGVTTTPAVSNAPQTPAPTQSPVVNTEKPATQSPLPTQAVKPTTAPIQMDEEEVAAIKAIIAEQKAKGASVSEDLASGEYEWKDGKLIKIWWDSRNLSDKIDFGGCKNLQLLYCANNEQLTSLDVSNNKNLSYLSYDETVTVTGYHPSEGANEQDVAVLKKIIAEQIKNGAKVSENLDSSQYRWEDGKLIEIAWDGKKLSGNLDVSGCKNLQLLSCDYGKLTDLDVSNCTNLVYLSCVSNQLESLNVSGCTNLKTLGCSFNAQLTSLDVSGCENLETLDCRGNAQLTSLDVSNNKNLSYLSCDETVTVTGYHPSEGANEQDVADLKKIISEQIKNGATISEDLDNLQYRWKDGKLVGIDWSVSSLSGAINLSDLKNLKSFSCYRNEITGLDVSGCTELEYLDCSWNKLTSLNVSGCTQLFELRCYGNELTSLDVGQCWELVFLDCGSNKLTTLDLSNNLDLADEDVECDSNVTIIR